jgi:hypothetical protein
MVSMVLSLNTGEPDPVRAATTVLVSDSYIAMVKAPS